MKKVLSVVLSLVMALSCCAIFAFAEGEAVEIYDGHLEALMNYALPSGQDYVVPAGKTLTVPAEKNLIVSVGTNLTVNGTLQINEGGRATVQSNVLVAKDAAILINGAVSVEANATLKIAGRVSNAHKISCDTQGQALAEIRFPNLQSLGLADKIYVSYAFGYTGGQNDDLIEGEGAIKWYTTPNTAETSVWAPLNQYIYIKAHIIEPAEISASDETGKYDDAKMNVYLNDVEAPYTTDNHSLRVLFSADVTYSDWSYDDYFIAERRINLRSGEGYTVYSRDGRTSANDGYVYIKYGQPFAFRVDIDPEYNMSAYHVYVVKGASFMEFDMNAVLDNSLEVYPDDSGYYHINPVQGDYTVFVLQVVKNETVQKVSGIFEMVKNIFEMISKFFRQFLDLFKFGN